MYILVKILFSYYSIFSVYIFVLKMNISSLYRFFFSFKRNTYRIRSKNLKGSVYLRYDYCDGILVNSLIISLDKTIPPESGWSKVINCYWQRDDRAQMRQINVSRTPITGTLTISNHNVMRLPPSICPEPI